MRSRLSLLLLAAVCVAVYAEDVPTVDLHSPALVSVSLNRPNPILIGSTFSVAVIASDTRPDAPLVVSWDLGDGQTFSRAMTYDSATSTFGDSLSYQYNVGGAYTIKASVSDENNNFATDSVVVVVPTVPALTSFRVDPNPAAAGSLVTAELSFDAYDDGTTLPKITMDFGDGSTPVTASAPSTGSLTHTVSLTHTYASAGSYVVSTSITDSIDQSIQFKRNVGVPNAPEINSFFISADGNTLTASLLFNAYAPGASVPVTFSFCDGHTQTIISYFDTGLGQYNAQCSHQINAAGVCTVTASVTDALQQTASVQKDHAY